MTAKRPGKNPDPAIVVNHFYAMRPGNY